MVASVLFPIFAVEIIRSILGLILIIVELGRLKSAIRQKATLSLVGILIFYNFIFITRAIGIGINNSNFRQFMPAISALFSAIFLVLWGSKVISLNKQTEKYALISIVCGISSFLIGVLFGNVLLAIIGTMLFGLTMLIIIAKMYHFVFSKSPYLQARYRIFLMSVAIVIMIIFEGIGVIAMRQHQFSIAASFFFFEISGRIIMNLSIILPERIKGFLSHFIT